MIYPVCHLRLSHARKPQLTCRLMCLLVGMLVLSACSPTGQGNAANTSNTLNALNSIAALSVNDIWAVGQASGRGASPLIEHWNGLVWSVIPAPGRGDTSVLEAVTARSPQDMWAVGEYYQRAGYETLIEHWNGSAWSIVASPNGPGDNELFSVAVLSATDAWAVGRTIPCPEPPALALRLQGLALVSGRPAAHSATCTDPKHALIEHWDGRAWSLVASPSPDPKADTGLDKVVAFGPADVWASGNYFYPMVTPEDGAALFEQWDGTAWRIRTDFDTAMVGRMWVSAFFSDSDIWGAEYATSRINQPVIKHWNGRVWSVVDAPFETSSSYTLDTLAGSRPDDLWAAGTETTTQHPDGQYPIFTMHWNGSTWRLVPCRPPARGDNSITASASLGPDDAWIAGFYFPSPSTQLIFLQHWDGHSWSLVPVPNPAQPAPAGQ